MGLNTRILVYHQCRTSSTLFSSIVVINVELMDGKLVKIPNLKTEVVWLVLKGCRSLSTDKSTNLNYGSGGFKNCDFCCS